MIKNKYSQEWRDAFYMSDAWRRKKEFVLKHYDYKCQLCKRYGRRRAATEVHHIKHLEDFPELALENSNLIALCHACHNKQHPEKIRAATECAARRRY